MQPLFRVFGALLVLASVFGIQAFWYYESRRWLVPLSRLLGVHLSRERLLHLHRWAFALLFAGLFAVGATQSYQMSRMHWWLTVAFSVYFVASLIGGLLLLAIQLVNKFIARKASKAESVGGNELAPPARSSRRAFLQVASGTAIAVPLYATSYGAIRERLNFQIEHVKLPLGPAAASLRGRTIAQLSDIHISPYLTAVDLRRAVDMVNELAPDLIFLTGDFVTFSGESQFDCVRELSRLRRRATILGCLGNHEIYTHTQDSITRIFEQQGIEILRYRSKHVELRGGALNIAGVDFTRHRYEFEVRRIAPYLRPEEVNILLSHNPNSFDYIDDLPIAACISGHTHGGQLRLEFVDADVSPALLMTRYIAGLYTRGNQHLYVNRGLGTIGVPIRLGSTPEITLFEIA